MEAKIIALLKPFKEPTFSPKFMSDQPLVHYRQTICADFKNNPKTH
jgi:hypothetical protein